MANEILLDSTYTRRIHEIVSLIPDGKVASYGQIARIVGGGVQARQVGYALAGLKTGSQVPWQRVINSKGRISLPGVGGALQKQLLLDEGLEFNDKDQIDFARFGWEGPGGEEQLRLFTSA